MSALFGINPEIALAVVGVIFVVLLGWIGYLEMRLRKFMRGRNGSSLEGVLAELIDGFEDHGKRHQSAAKDIERMYQVLAHTPRGVATVRFNALSGNASGRQSFATALITQHGDGVVISSMHSRDTTRVYAKPLSNFASEHELSEEEVAAIEAAKLRCPAC